MAKDKTKRVFVDKESGSIGFVEDTDDDLSEAEKGRPGDEEVRDSPSNRLLLGRFVLVFRNQ